MRQGPHSKRLRGRGNGRKNTNPRSQSFESSGPEVKVRGNAQQVVEKYLQLARDATSSGDRITAESYFQHAEHYYRVMTANGGGSNAANGNGHDTRDGNANASSNSNANANGGGRDKRAQEQKAAPGDGPQPDIPADAPQPEASEDQSSTAPRDTGDGQEPVSA